MLNNILTIQEVANKWGKHPTTVKKAINTNRLFAIKSESTWLINYIDVFNLWGKEINDIDSYISNIVKSDVFIIDKSILSALEINLIEDIQIKHSSIKI